MKLTEAKFIISEYSEHHRPNRKTKRRVPGGSADDSLGPDGLGFGPREYKLGTIEELFEKRKDCPFCGLAITSLNGQFKAFIQDSEHPVSSEEEFYKLKATCFVSMYKPFPQFSILFKCPF